MQSITLSKFDDAAEALRNTDLAQALYDEGAVIMDGVLLTLHGEEHHARRALEYRVFRRGFFKIYEQEIFPATVDETLAPLTKAGRADLVEFGYRTTMNLTADFAGIDRPQRTTEETDTLLRLVRKFGEGATLVHSTRDKDVVRQEVKDALAEFEQVFLKPSIAKRAKLLSEVAAGERREDKIPNDVLTVLLQNEDRVELAEDTLCREMAFYLQAGSHSTANATTHAMHEIFTWSRDHPADGERMHADPLFLQRCVHESLRLHPASPVSWRRAAAPCRIAGQGLSENDRLIIDLHQANRDPSIFGADAETFNPHRKIPEGHLPFGLTFGLGRHACLGRDLDGGVLPNSDTIPSKHQLGIVALLIAKLFSHGARPDPDHPPIEDTETERANWARYPILLNAKESQTK